jgi:hypothetical protein
MITTEAMVAETPKKKEAPAMPGSGVAEWITEGPIDRRLGFGDAPPCQICRPILRSGRNPSAPDREDSLMQNVAWYQGESLKRLLQGAALGAFATLGIGFSWGGFMLGSTPQTAWWSQR